MHQHSILLEQCSKDIMAPVLLGLCFLNIVFHTLVLRKVWRWLSSWIPRACCVIAFTWLVVILALAVLETIEFSVLGFDATMIIVVLDLALVFNCWIICVYFEEYYRSATSENQGYYRASQVDQAFE